LVAKIYPPADTAKSSHKELPDWVEIYRELKRKGMTKQLLWEEYTQQSPNRSFSYAQYYCLYRSWLKKQRRSMRQTHKAGQTVPVIGNTTGEIGTAQIFVAVLGVKSSINIS
jgi:transposase